MVAQNYQLMKIITCRDLFKYKNFDLANGGFMKVIDDSFGDLFIEGIYIPYSFGRLMDLSIRTDKGFALLSG